jgi:hypothetical protein
MWNFRFFWRSEVIINLTAPLYIQPQHGMAYLPMGPKYSCRISVVVLEQPT